MKVLTPASEAEAISLVAVIDRTMGYPMRGTHVGEGRHVAMPDTWDGNGEPPPGWSASYVEIYYAEGKTPIVPIDDADAQRILSRAHLLGQQDRVALVQALGARAEKDLEGEKYNPASARAVRDKQARPTEP